VFTDGGIDVHTETPVTALEAEGDDVAVEADGPDGTVETAASDVLLAAGRRPNTDGIGLEEAGVETDERGFVETDDSFETTADGVYAIGDVSGPPMFTHSARDDADLLYRHLTKDEEISTESRTVPWAVFTDLQVGHVVGEQGAEIVHELVLAVELGATADDIANTMHIHPTLPESINSAAGGVHKPS